MNKVFAGVIITVMSIGICRTAFAQVPKAYDLQIYNGKVNGHFARLKLASGYLA